MVTLRHLGFPSPLLDWTENFKIAAFFAFAGGAISDADNAAIYTLTIKKLEVGERFELYKPWFYYIRNDAIKYKNERHSQQKSVYTLGIYNDQIEHLSENKRDPYFCLDLISHPRCSIEKYVIKDSKEIHLHLIAELFKENINYEQIYGETDKHENTRLKDIAIQEFLLKPSFL